MPTEKALVEEFSVSRATVRQGLMVLVNEGLGSLMLSWAQDCAAPRTGQARCYRSQPNAVLISTT